jgi:hypothetical protein
VEGVTPGPAGHRTPPPRMVGSDAVCRCGTSDRVHGPRPVNPGRVPVQPVDDGSTANAERKYRTRGEGVSGKPSGACASSSPPPTPAPRRSPSLSARSPTPPLRQPRRRERHRRSCGLSTFM